MKLPDVSWGSVPNTIGPAQERVAGAVEKLSDTAAAGLTAMGQELIKSQTLDAHAALSEKLDALHTELGTRKAIPVDELKRRLGPSFDKLDPSIREPPMVTVPADPNEFFGPGAPTGVDKPSDVPTWKVADAIYREEAQKHLEAAAQHIGSSGWQSSFKRAAMADVVHRLGALDAQQAQAMHEDLTDARQRQIGAYVKAGNFELAHAAADASMQLFGEKGVRDVKDSIAVAEQVKPIFDALTRINQPLYRAEGLRQVTDALAQIGDPSKFTKLTAEQREKFAHELNTAASAHQGLQAQRDAAKIAFEIAAASKDLRNPAKIDPGKAFDELDARLQRGDFKGREELWPDTRRVLQEHIRDRNEASKATFGQVAGDALSQFMSLGPDNRPHYALSNVKQETRTALETYGEEGQKVLKDLVKWSEEESERGLRKKQLPTADQDARATAVERSIHRNPALWRGMPTADVLEILGGHSPVPGEEDAPGVGVSSRDFPHIRELLAKNTEAPQTVDVLTPHQVAQQEFERAFNLEGKASKRWGRDALEANRLVMDDVSRFVNARINDPKGSGKRPTEAEIRDHLRDGPFRSVQVKRLMGLVTSETPAIKAQVKGQDVVGAPAPARSALVPGAVLPSEQVRDPKTGKFFPAGASFRVNEKGQLERVK